MLIYFNILFLIGLILYICKLINKSKLNREKIRVYECGFQEFNDAKKKYFLKFYLIAIIFLIFDIETIILYPITINIMLLSNFGFFLFLFFIFMLTIGLAFEIYNSIII